MSTEAPILYAPTNDGRRPFVIGSTGGIGPHYLRRIAETSEVLAGYRNPADYARLIAIHPNVIPVIADVTNPESLRKIFDTGVSDVFNIGARMSMTGLAQSQKVNIEGTENALREAEKVGIRHFHHMSTRGVYGRQEIFPITEDAPHNGTTVYAITKSGGEKAVTDGSHNFPVTVVRPADVIGADLDIWTHSFLNFIDGIEFTQDFRFEKLSKIMNHTPIKRVPIPLSAVAVLATKAVFIPVEVENLVDLSMLAIQNKNAEGQVFNAADFHSTFCTIINAYAREILGKQTYIASEFLINSATGITSGALKSAGALLNSQALSEASGYFSESNYRLSMQKAKEILGYEPRISFPESIRQTKEYVKKYGLVRSSQLYNK